MYKAKTSCLEYLFLFFLIIEFNTPYTYFPFIRKGVYLMIFVLLLSLILLKDRKVKVDFMVLVIIFGSLLPFLNVASEQLSRYIRMYVIFLPLLVIYLTTLFKKGREWVYSLLLKYSNIVNVLAVVSLFFWTFGSILEIIPYTAIIPNSWGIDKFIPTYYGVYFETQETMAIVRNSGIFNEAPMHNMILCMALAVEILIRPKISKMRVLVLIVTIISTVSTTGFIFLILLLVGKSYLTMNIRRRSVFMLFLPLILLFAVFFISTILENKKETGEGSYNSRSGDIVRCVEVGLENPILGVELFHKADERSGSAQSGYGYSNSLFTIFAHGGFYMWVLYLLPLLVMPYLCYKKDKDIHMLGVMLCYFFLFAFTASHYKYLTLFYMAIGLSYWNVVFWTRNKIRHQLS